MAMNRHFLFTVMALSGAITVNLHAERIVTTLNQGWEFTKVVCRPSEPTDTDKQESFRITDLSIDHPL